MPYPNKVKVKGHEYCQLLEKYKDENGVISLILTPPQVGSLAYPTLTPETHYRTFGFLTALPLVRKPSFEAMVFVENPFVSRSFVDFFSSAVFDK
jgi:hypothetical protein